VLRIEDELLFPRRPIITLDRWRELVEPAAALAVLAGWSPIVSVVRCRRCLERDLGPDVIVEVLREGARVLAATDNDYLTAQGRGWAWRCPKHLALIGARTLTPEDVDVNDPQITRLFYLWRKVNVLMAEYPATFDRAEVGRKIDKTWGRIDRLSRRLGAITVERARNIADTIVHHGGSPQGGYPK